MDTMIAGCYSARGIGDGGHGLKLQCAQAHNTGQHYFRIDRSGRLPGKQLIPAKLSVHAPLKSGRGGTGTAQRKQIVVFTLSLQPTDECAFLISRPKRTAGQAFQGSWPFEVAAR
jgi:hypothetical protein